MKLPSPLAPWIASAFLIGLGAYVALPRESGARMNARRASCLINLKMIALATSQYRKDYDGFFPPVSSGEDVGWADC